MKDQPRKLTRREVLRKGLAATLSLPYLTSCRSGDSRDTVTALGWVANVEYADLWIALERGYFAAEGIHLKYLPGGPNAPQPVVELAAGEADIGEAEWLPLLDAISHGNDFVILGAGYPTLPAGIITLPGRPMLKPADLVGGRFLFQGPTERTQLEAVFEINHLRRDYKLIPVGYSPEALLNGAGDAYCCFVTNQPITLERMGMKQGKDFFVTRLFDLGYKVPSTLIFVQRHTLETRRSMLVGYLRALLRGRADNVKDPRYAARLATDKFGADLGLDLEQQTRENELQIPLELSPRTNLPFWVGPEDLTGSMYTAARATGRRNLPEPKRILDTSILTDAYEGIVYKNHQMTGQQGCKSRDDSVDASCIGEPTTFARAKADSLIGCCSIARIAEFHRG